MRVNAAPDDDGLFLSLELDDDSGIEIEIDVEEGASAAPAFEPTCLVVDDDDALLHLYSTRLANAGWRVMSAQGGEAALALALATPPDLVVSDVHMPLASGWSLLVDLKDHPLLRDIPTILMSADDVFVESAAAADLGATRIVSKSALRGDELVVLARSVTEDALRVSRALAGREKVSGDFAAVAPRRLLALLGLSKAKGHLCVEDTEPPRRCEVLVNGGCVVGAGLYSAGKFSTELPEVVLAVLSMTAGRFSFAPTKLDGEGPRIEDVLQAFIDDAGLEGVSGIDAAARRAFAIDERRFALYDRQARPEDAAVARKIIQAGSLMDAMAASDDPVAADRVVMNLLRMGVIRMRREA